jgi:WD40 repeat protein
MIHCCSRIFIWFFCELFVVFGCVSLPIQRPVVRLEEAHFLGSTQVAFSPNSKLLASGGFKGDIKIWSVPSGKMVTVIKAHAAAIRGMVWVDNGFLLSGADDGRVMLWDLTNEKPTQVKANLFSSAVKGLAFFSKNREIVSGHKDGMIRVLGYPSLQAVRERNLKRRVLAIRSSHDASMLAVSVKGEKVFLMDRYLQTLQALQLPSRNIFSLAFAPDGSQLAGAGWYEIFLWDLADGHMKKRDTHHFGKIIAIDYSPNGKYIASIGRITDSKIFITHAKSGILYRNLLGHSLCGTALRFSPNGQYIASTSDDRSVRIYDLIERYPYIKK